MRTGPNAPDCSLLVAAHNRPAALLRALQSCLGDPSLSLEVIIIDDGSSVPLWPAVAAQWGGDAACAPLSDEGRASLTIGEVVVEFVRKPNGGAASARNAGLALARGQFVKFLDDDDVLLPGVLAREVAFAQDRSVDVVLTGRIDRYHADEACRSVERERVVSAPRLDRGVDDLLEGQAPFTSSGLYRTSLVSRLRWDEACEKAEEWLWAWTVAAAGATFATLDEPSFVYMRYPSTARVTSSTSSQARSVKWRQYVLAKAEELLVVNGLLTPARRGKLVQYYFKDARYLSFHEPAAWSTLCGHLRSLDPGFLPRDPSRIVNLLNALVGYERGMRWFSHGKSLVLHLKAAGNGGWQGSRR